MSAEESQKLFEQHVKSPELRMHCKEVSTIMTFLAREFNEDAEKWEMIGLLHDLDFDFEKSPSEHGKKTAEILKEKGYSEDVIHAILSHNEENLAAKRESRLDYALSAADNVSGLIYAYALMRKTIDGMEVSGLKKKIKDKKFAANVNRNNILDIEKAGMALDKFLDISIKAMSSIAKDVGL